MVRLPKRHAVVLAASAAAVGFSLLGPRSAHATVMTAASSGYGLDVSLTTTPLVSVTAGPLPSDASGIAPAGYNVSKTTLGVNVAGTGLGALLASATVGADAVSGTAFSNVDGHAGIRTTSATGGVVNAAISANVLAVKAGPIVITPGVELLGLNGTLSSSAQATGNFGSLSYSGSTTITSLALVIDDIPINLSAFVGAGVTIAPNTGINLSALGIANASLILNEQTNVGGVFSVNALDLKLNLASLITGDVVLGHSQVTEGVVSTPEPASLSVLGLGALSLLKRRRRA